MSIRTRVVLLAVVPLIIVTLLGTAKFINSRSTHRAMVKTETLCQLAVVASRFIHESQKERGYTAGFLGSGGQKFRSELKYQQSESDTRLEELMALVDSIDFDQFPKKFSGPFHTAMDETRKLDQQRNSVGSQACSVADAVNYYTTMNGMFLDSISSIVVASDVAELNRFLAAYASFLKGKERMGIERAVLTGTFAADKFAPGFFEKFIALVFQQEAFFGEFILLAGTEQRQKYQKATSGAAFKEVASMRATARAKANEGGFGIDPTYWFNTITSTIETLKGLEDEFAGDLASLAEEERAGAGSSMASTATFIAISIAIALGLGYWCVHSIVGSLKRLVTRLADISQGEGDLTKRVEVTSRDELGQLGGLFNSFMDKLEPVISKAVSGADRIDSDARQIASASQTLASGASEQAASLEEISASLEEMSSMTENNADHSQQASGLSQDSLASAKRGSEQMEAMSKAMGAIKTSADKISGVIKVIDEMAFQTNLLALNAAVEAARAGEAGKGFAVVAEEVRSLAQRSADAARETSEMIQESSERADAGVELSEKVNVSLKEIVGGTEKIHTLLSEIALASKEQADGIGQINRGVTELDNVTQQNAASSEELASSSSQTASEVQTLRSVLREFKVRQDSQRGHEQIQSPLQPSPLSSPSPVVEPMPERAPEMVTAGAASSKELIPFDDDLESF